MPPGREHAGGTHSTELFGGFVRLGIRPLNVSQQRYICYTHMLSHSTQLSESTLEGRVDAFMSTTQVSRDCKLLAATPLLLHRGIFPASNHEYA